uniref:Tc1-like transposase DDE domain-containing protein n=1 Tax=Panagrolaimus sp. ES5 TaxID=591445 RepID=A0AC34GAP6_9BILA
DLLARRNVLINIPSSSNGEVARQLREIEAIINNRGLGGNSEAAASNSVKFVDRRIPAQKRYQLVKLLNAGYGISRAAKTLNISRSGAIYVRDRAAELGLLRNRQARKRVFLQKEINDFILQTLRVNHSTTKKELRDMLRKQGHNLTLAQVRYRIGALGFTWRKMKKVQVISPQNRQKRLDTRAFWESENYDFRNYLFVDECTVVLGRQQQFCWVRKGEKVPCKGRVTHGSGYHVFAGISWRGATDILVWNSKHRMNSAFYCNHNIKEIVAKARHLFEAGQFQLVQDNHRAHVSNYTKNYLEQAGIDTFVWPPQSPDWNPPEFSWRDLKRYVEEKAPKTMAELLNVIQEFWATKVTPAYCRTIIRNSINNIKKSHDGLNHEKDAPRDTLYQK